MWRWRYRRRLTQAVLLLAAGAAVLILHALPSLRESPRREQALSNVKPRAWTTREGEKDRTPTTEVKSMWSQTNRRRSVNLTELFDFFKVPAGREDTLLNEHKFQYSLDSDVCKGNPLPFVLIFIHSAVANFERRSRVRETFGKVKQVGGKRIGLVFILGEADAASKANGVASLRAPLSTRQTGTDLRVGIAKINSSSSSIGRDGHPPPFSLQERLQHESQQFKDIVQGNFKDSYRNLTYKHVMALDWVRMRCKDVQHVLKLDDDVLVDPYLLVDFLSDATRMPEGWGHVLYCSVFRHQGPVRRVRDKWYMPPTVYPFATFPDYCEGYAYLSSPGALALLHQASRSLAFFWVDDVYVTGVLASRAGVRRLDMQRGFAAEKMFPSSVDQVGSQLFFLAKYRLNEVYWQDVWNAVARKWALRDTSTAVA